MFRTNIVLSSGVVLRTVRISLKVINMESNDFEESSLNLPHDDQYVIQRSRSRFNP
jgi:hypothetical protein